MVTNMLLESQIAWRHHQVAVQEGSVTRNTLAKRLISVFCKETWARCH
jgi:hypothetical protein